MSNVISLHSEKKTVLSNNISVLEYGDSPSEISTMYKMGKIKLKPIHEIVFGDEMHRAMKSNAGSGMQMLMMLSESSKVIVETIQAKYGDSPYKIPEKESLKGWILSNGKIDLMLTAGEKTPTQFMFIEASPRNQQIHFEILPKEIREFQKSLLQMMIAYNLENPVKSWKSNTVMPVSKQEVEQLKNDFSRIEKFFANPKSEEFKHQPFKIENSNGPI